MRFPCSGSCHNASFIPFFISCTLLAAKRFCQPRYWQSVSSWFKVKVTIRKCWPRAGRSGTTWRRPSMKCIPKLYIRALDLVVSACFNYYLGKSFEADWTSPFLAASANHGIERGLGQCSGFWLVRNLDKKIQEINSPKGQLTCGQAWPSCISFSPLAWCQGVLPFAP